MSEVRRGFLYKLACITHTHSYCSLVSKRREWEVSGVWGEAFPRLLSPWVWGLFIALAIYFTARGCIARVRRRKQRGSERRSEASFKCYREDWARNESSQQKVGNQARRALWCDGLKCKCGNDQMENYQSVYSFTRRQGELWFKVQIKETIVMGVG